MLIFLIQIYQDFIIFNETFIQSKWILFIKLYSVEILEPKIKLQHFCNQKVAQIVYLILDCDIFIFLVKVSML